MINLTGNHEDMFLTALDSGKTDAVQHWLANGGAPTLASWGVPRRAGPRDWARDIAPAPGIRRPRGYRHG